ncbi:MAG: TIGR03905 family TSCPD domain-containing protein [Coriobacteriales bacterium]|nr:TIGR03905 family TSCPD domain-containing protein [Coriobacteriales bacterium]
MSERHTYMPRGTCSQIILIETEGDVIESVEFIGGCDGNLKGIGKLVAGQRVAEVADMLEGITCGYKSTSCPDQLSRALREIEAGNA